MTISFDGLPERRLLPVGEVVFRVPGSEGELEFLQIDALGRILLVDRATFAVLAFSEEGSLLLRAQPEPDDFGRGLASSLPRWASASPDGGLRVRVTKGLIEFDREGRWLGRTGVEDWSAPEELSWRDGTRSWELDLFVGHLELHDAEGLVLATAERGAHERWMRSLRSPSVGIDGSLAVLDASYGTVDIWLHVFDGDGRALTSVALPPAWSSAPLAYDGARIALLAERRVLLLDRSGTLTGWAALPEGWDPCEIACGPNGELWLFDGPRMRRSLVP